MRAMLKSWPLDQQRAFFERDLKIRLTLEEETGKLFPESDRARDVRDGLVRFAGDHGVRLMFGTSVTDVSACPNGWLLETSRGQMFAERVVIATGGLSVPATGSDGVGLRIALKLGHREEPTYPALTPLVADFVNGHPHSALAGVSLNVRLRARVDDRTTETSGGFLFTHRGYSGPAVLDISHVARQAKHLVAAPPGTAARQRPVIRVQWAALGAAQWTRELDAGRSLATSVLTRHVPNRLAERLMNETDVPKDRRGSDLRRSERAALVERLTSYELPWTGDEGYRKAESPVGASRWTS